MQNPEQGADRILQLLEHLPAGVFFLNEQLEIIYANTFFNHLFSMDTFDTFGKKLEDFLEPSSSVAKQLIADIAAMEISEIREIDIVMRYRDMPQILCNLSLKHHQFGNQKTYLAIIDDISDLKKSEVNLKKSADKFEKLTKELEAAIRTIKKQNTQLKQYNTHLDREMQIANNIQQAILPQKFPTWSNAEIFGQSRQLNGVGGDYFDVLKFEEDLWGLVVADVSGHGVAASMLTSMMKVYLEHGILHSASPDEIFRRTNEQLCRFLKGTGLFVTAIMMVVNLKNGQVIYTSAGHQSYLCLTSEGRFKRIHEDRVNPVLGLELDSRFEKHQFSLNPGDHLFLYTDGIPEARNRSGDFWGEGALMGVLKQNPESSAKTCNEAVFSALEDFCKPFPANDDRTLLNLKYQS